jgi:rhamnosyltransferase
LTPDVSIVIPTRNGMATLPALVDAIGQQTDAAPRELVIIDSRSTDGTRDYAARVADVVIDIEPQAFNHASARNAAVSRARGSLVVLTVQDARPLDAAWLGHLLAPLRDDPDVAGVFARQTPRPDASPVVRRQLEGWVASQTTPRVTATTSGALADRPPHERLSTCAFDNVCSAVRRKVWDSIPFATTPIAEDLEWGRNVLLAGYRIAFAPLAGVEHSHDRDAWYEFKRTWVLHQQLHRLFGLRAIPSPAALARSLALTLGEHHRVTVGGGYRTGSAEWRRAMRLAIAWPCGQFAGGWTAATGRAGWRPGGV